MNSKENTTVLPATASEPDAATLLDLATRLEAVTTLVDGISGKMTDLVHASSFLMADLEWAFDRGRGQDHGTHGIRLVFQKSGIEATLWLMSKIWDDIRDVHEVLQQASRECDAVSDVIDERVAA